MFSLKTYLISNYIKPLGKYRWLSSAINVSRALMLSVFGLITNYILLHYQINEVLTTYVYFISTANIMLAFTGWGGRDFYFQFLSKDLGQLKSNITKLVNSKLPLLLLAIILSFCLPIALMLKIFIAIYLILRTFNTIFDILVVLNKKYYYFFLIDCLIQCLFIALILFNKSFNNPLSFIMLVLTAELVKTLVFVSKFRSFVSFYFQWSSGVTVLKKALPFFSLSLAGFLCYKSDFYMLTIHLNSRNVSNYFILTNFISLYQIAFSSLLGTYAPQVLRMHSKGFKGFAKLSVLIGFLTALSACIFIFLLLDLYYKIQFDFLVFIILFFNLMLFTFIYILMQNYSKHDRIGTTVKYYWIGGVLNIVLSYLFSEKLGVLGAIMSNTVSIGFIFCLLYWNRNRKVYK